MSPTIVSELVQSSPGSWVAIIFRPAARISRYVTHTAATLRFKVLVPAL